MENEQEKSACLNCSISKFDEKCYCNYEMKGDLDMIFLMLGDILIQIAKDLERTPSEVAAESLAAAESLTAEERGTLDG